MSNQNFITQKLKQSRKELFERKCVLQRFRIDVNTGFATGNFFEPYILS